MDGERLPPAPGPPLAVGDAVHVWSLSRGQWFQDGVVREVAAEDRRDADGSAVPQGSLLVTYNGGAGVKWVAPEEQPQLLRPPSAPVFSLGDTAHVWSVSKGRWFRDGAVRAAAPPGGCEADDGDQLLPGGALLVTYDGGAGRKWIMPWEQHRLLKKAPEPAGIGPAAECLLAGPHGAYLAEDGGCLCMVEGPRARPWALTPVGSGSGRRYLISQRGLFLAVADAGEQSLGLVPEAAEQSLWALLPADGGPESCFLRSSAGTHLASLNDRAQTLYMSPNCAGWETWRRVSTGQQPEARASAAEAEEKEKEEAEEDEEHQRARGICARDVGRLSWRLTSLGCDSRPTAVANDLSFEELRWMQAAQTAEGRRELQERLQHESQGRWDAFLAPLPAGRAAPAGA